MQSTENGVTAAQRRDRADTGGQDALSVCEGVLAAHDALGLCASIEPRRREQQDADLRLLFADRMYLRSPAGKEMLVALERHPLVASAQRHKSAVLLRFEDTFLADLERRAARDGTEAARRPDALVGQRFLVSFVGANTNKALHVGHLRNIFLGEALSSTLTSAGASVERHSLVGDIGRRVCEAMVGYLSHHDGEDPETAGMAGDRFVELCCRGYPREAERGCGEHADDPNAEENEVRGDRADGLMAAWLANEPQARELWLRMRDWVLDGHRRTLARLGVRIDRHDCESQAIERALAIVAKGLERGLFERESAGGAVYRTGRSEYATMVLLREDGAPTEYARLLGLYDLILDDLDSAQSSYVEVVGIEWRAAALVLGELLAELRRLPTDPCTWAFHGSVTLEGQKMGSSTGEVMWVDDLLDAVAAGAGVDALHELAGGAIGRDELADMVVRGAFLCSPTTQSLAFELDRLVEGGPGAGWTIARAWCLAQHAQERLREAPVQEPPGEAPVARTVLVQSQLYWRSLRRAAEGRDTGPLASYLLGLSEACLAASAPGPAAVPALRRALGSLGFCLANEKPQRDEPAGMPNPDRYAFTN